MRAKSPKNLEPGLKMAVQAVGTHYALAKALKINPSSVLRWRRIPAERVVQVEQATGIDRAKLRPDLYT
jgi:DNA-binding transcriptional regulator YdaS (Cro superfamily)